MPGRAYGKRKSMREAEEQTDLIIPSSPGPFVYFTRGYAPQNHKTYIYIGYAQNRMEQGGCGPTYSYCEHNNGLELPWYPRVFLNPPYGNLTKTFTTKLVKEINDKNVTEAVVVLSLEHVTTSWFKNMHRACLPNVAWAIPYERISFIKPNTAGTQADSPITGNLIMYYGEHKQRFWKAFQDIAYSIQMAELI